MSKGFDIAFSLLITGLILGKLHFEMKGVNFTKESYVDVFIHEVVRGHLLKDNHGKALC